MMFLDFAEDFRMSSNLYYLEVNIIALIVLGILYNNERKKLARTVEQKSFNLIIASVIMVVAMDTIMWVVNGHNFIGAFAFNWIASTVYYFFNCFVPFSWFFYVVVYCNLYQRYFETKRKYILILPLFINTVMAIINYFTHWMFYIDEANMYVRGDLFIIPSVLALLYLVLAACVIFRKYKVVVGEEERGKMKTMMTFMVLPILGAIVQIEVYGVSLIWIGATLSILMVFINIQNSQITTDMLTGLNNRYQFNRYLNKVFLIENEREDDGLILIDVNKFKTINDIYGHLVGDEALIKTSVILKDCCNKHKSFLARYGGDEFIIVCKDKDHQELIYLINEKITEFNDMNKEVFKLSLSIGYAAFKDPMVKTIDELVAHADREMYVNKKNYQEQMKLDLK